MNKEESPCNGICNVDHAVCCGVKKPASHFYCTLPKGHKESHVACSQSDHNVTTPWHNDFTGAYDMSETIKADCSGKCGMSPICGQNGPDGYYACTLAEGHSGPHIACGGSEHNMATWPNMKDKPPTKAVNPAQKTVAPKDCFYFSSTIICTTGEIFFIPFIPSCMGDFPYYSGTGYTLNIQTVSKWSYGDRKSVQISTNKIKKIIFKRREVTKEEYKLASDKAEKLEHKMISEQGVWPIQRGKLKDGQTSALYNDQTFINLKGKKPYGK